jgi:hypothetical protein
MRATVVTSAVSPGSTQERTGIPSQVTVLVPAQPRELDVWGIRVEQRAGAGQPCGVYSVYPPGNRPFPVRVRARMTA